MYIKLIKMANNNVCSDLLQQMGCDDVEDVLDVVDNTEDCDQRYIPDNNNVRFNVTGRSGKVGFALYKNGRWIEKDVDVVVDANKEVWIELII